MIPKGPAKLWRTSDILLLTRRTCKELRVPIECMDQSRSKRETWTETAELFSTGRNELPHREWYPDTAVGFPFDD
jgi:hypothetical protein